MVLECFDIYQPEAYLRHLLECDESGTTPDKVVEAVIEHFGLARSRKSSLNLDDLQKEISRGVYPIVYLDLFNQGIQDAHAVIVTEIVEGKVHIVDPASEEKDGFRAFDLAEFDRAWMAVYGRTIIIE
jgi:ABC-type bacteriocin/lantibiotic exporter with double-glycine peptidase domain